KRPPLRDFPACYCQLPATSLMTVSPGDHRNSAFRPSLPLSNRRLICSRNNASLEHPWSASIHRLAGLFTAFAILCGSTASPALAEDKILTVFAAASMKNALDDIAAAFTAKAGHTVTASLAASSTL